MRLAWYLRPTLVHWLRVAWEHSKSSYLIPAMWTVRGCPSRSFGVDVMPTGSMLIKNEHQSFSAIAMLALIASSEWLSMPELSAASKAAASVRPSLIGCRAASMRHALTAVPVEQADTSPCPARTSSYTNHRANSKSPSEIAASTAAALDDAPSAKARARISLARVPIAVETNPKRPPEATRMVSRDDSSVTVPTVRIANKRLDALGAKATDIADGRRRQIS
mmetsp:Transcript_7447/g.23013  ORF Transcript_7447/g.23013 Transcript_7447/m.23013 type:complete len:222 (-) Transcript_7447:2155-2820(-)